MRQVVRVTLSRWLRPDLKSYRFTELGHTGVFINCSKLVTNMLSTQVLKIFPVYYKKKKIITHPKKKSAVKRKFFFFLFLGVKKKFRGSTKKNFSGVKKKNNFRAQNFFFRGSKKKIFWVTFFFLIFVSRPSRSLIAIDHDFSRLIAIDCD